MKAAIVISAVFLAGCYAPGSEETAQDETPTPVANPRRLCNECSGAADPRVLENGLAACHTKRCIDRLFDAARREIEQAMPMPKARTEPMT